MDEDLMAAINAQAGLAKQARPNMTELHASAMTLNQDLDERSLKEIEAKIGDVWRHRGLYGGSEQNHLYWSWSLRTSR